MFYIIKIGGGVDILSKHCDRRTLLFPYCLPIKCFHPMSLFIVESVVYLMLSFSL